MLKIEKHKEEIEKIDIRRKSIDCYLAQLSNTYKPGCCNDIGCSTCLKNSLLELMKEYKELIKLTRFEYEYLNFAKEKGYNFIARDRNDRSFIYFTEPYKNTTVWITNDSFVLIFSELFNFVKWEDEEPWKIEEILSNCEVVENDNLD